MDNYLVIVHIFLYFAHFKQSNMAEEIPTEAESAYNDFKEYFNLAYPMIDISPSLIKLCFLKGYAMGVRDMYKIVTDALLPESNKRRL